MRCVRRGVAWQWSYRRAGGCGSVPERRLGQMRGQTGARTRPQPPRAVASGQLRRVGRSVPKVALPLSLTLPPSHPSFIIPPPLLSSPPSLTPSSLSFSLNHTSFSYAIKVFISITLLFILLSNLCFPSSFHSPLFFSKSSLLPSSPHTVSSLLFTYIPFSLPRMPPLISHRSLSLSL